MAGRRQLYSNDAVPPGIYLNNGKNGDFAETEVASALNPSAADQGDKS
jgi:hypothetical protein